MAEDIHSPPPPNPVLLPRRPSLVASPAILPLQIMALNIPQIFGLHALSTYTRSPTGAMTLPTDTNSCGGGSRDTTSLDENMKISPSSSCYPVSAFGIKLSMGRRR